MGLIAQARPTFRPHIKLRARRKVCVSRRAVTIGSAVKMLKTPTAGVLGRGHRLRSSQGAHSPYLTPHAADLAAANRGWASCGVSGKDQNRSSSLRLRAAPFLVEDTSLPRYATVVRLATMGSPAFANSCDARTDTRIRLSSKRSAGTRPSFTRASKTC
jgi:hypothetical protein